MEKEVPQVAIEMSPGPNPQKNPRKAATKLKEMKLNLQIMRNRFKVIQGKDQYSRFRTLDHSKRIEHHNSIHKTISKEKEELRKSMEARAEISDVKIRNELLRNQIKKNIAESRKVMLDVKVERSQIIAEEFAKNEQRIKEMREQDVEDNKTRRSVILQQQEQKRQNLQKHFQNKLKYTLLEKEKDSHSLSKEASNLAEQLTLMMDVQKQLHQKYSKSLQASQNMRNKYNQIVNISQRSISQKLPQVKPNIIRYTTISQSH